MDSLIDLLARVTRFPALCAALGDLVSVLEDAADGPGWAGRPEVDDATLASVHCFNNGRVLRPVG